MTEENDLLPRGVIRKNDFFEVAKAAAVGSDRKIGSLTAYSRIACLIADGTPIRGVLNAEVFAVHSIDLQQRLLGTHLLPVLRGGGDIDGHVYGIVSIGEHWSSERGR